VGGLAMRKPVFEFHIGNGNFSCQVKTGLEA